VQSVRALAFGAFAAACGACGLVFDVDALGSGGDDASLGDGGRDAAGDAGEGPGGDDGAARDAAAADVDEDGPAGNTSDGATPCPSSKGPAMVAAGGVCIDRTQVSVADYGAFLAATKNAPPLGAPCDWVSSLQPDDWSTQLATPKHPVTTVTWCGAFTYCAWAGKRLCGRVGGGPVLLSDAGVDPTTNQWYRACSRAGTRAYPYGSTQLPGACPSYPTVDDVGTHPSCEGGYPGLLDMTANVAEWTDGCDDEGKTNHAIDACTAMGSSNVTGGTACADSEDLSRHYADATIGFRCCGP
jgi:formylglycine-generating enzyme